MDRLFLLEAFVRVVDRGSISAAARDLKIPQPTLSRHIKTLEESFGARLIERTTHSHSLTDSGALVYERARRVLDEYEGTRDILNQGVASLSGPLKLNSPVAFGETHIARLMTQFQKQSPNVMVELTLTDAFVDLVEEGVDAALRTGVLEDVDYVARLLGHMERIFVASPAYLSQYDVPVHPDELVHHHVLMFGMLRDYGTQSLYQGEKVVQVGVSNSFRTNNGAALISAFVDGYGMGEVATTLVHKELARGELVRVLPEWEAAAMPIYFVYPRSRYLKPKIKALSDYLASTIPTLPGIRALTDN